MAREYFYFPDAGNETHDSFRLVVDAMRDELIFPVFTDEDKARAWMPDREVFHVWRETWKQAEKRAKSRNCVAMIVDPEPTGDDKRSNLERENLQYLENPNKRAHHYLRNQ